MSDGKYCPVMAALGNYNIFCFKDCEWWVHSPTSEDPERGRCVVHQIAAHLGILARAAVLKHVQETGEMPE